MGKLTAVKVKSLKEPGWYSDGEGLILKLFGTGRGSWIVRVQTNGKRQDIGLGKLSDVRLRAGSSEQLPVIVLSLAAMSNVECPRLSRLNRVPAVVEHPANATRRA